MSCDCEAPSAFNQTTRRARKAHDCCECHVTIQPGEAYQYISGVWDGRGDSFKTCVECAALRVSVARFADADECGVPFRHLSEWISHMSPGDMKALRAGLDAAPASALTRIEQELDMARENTRRIYAAQADARKQGRNITLLQAREEIWL